MGYASKDYTIASLRLLNGATIQLKKTGITLKTVEVRPDLLTAKVIRHQKTKTGRATNFSISKKPNQNLGAAIGRRFNIKKMSQLTEFKFYIGYLNNFDAPIMADVALGYFWHKPNLNANVSWRTYRSAKSGFGAIQNIKRNSFALELSRGLFDYKGFVPLLGPILSYEILSAKERFEDVEVFNVQQKKLSYGIIFGWDIRPTHKDWWYFRTNLRYFPNLKINVKDGLDLSAGVLEFNFIQLILYPKRMFK